MNALSAAASTTGFRLLPVSLRVTTHIQNLNLLLDEFTKEHISKRCSFFVISHWQGCDPLRYQILEIWDFIRIRLQDFSNARTSIFGGKNIVFATGVGYLADL